MKSNRFLIGAIGTVLPVILSAQIVATSSDDWPTGRNTSISFFDGFATVRPGVFVNGVVGDSSVSDPGTLEVGSHDPYRNGFSLQGIELAASLDLGQGLGGDVVYLVYEDEENNSLDGEFEEIYGTLDLPGLGLKGGRYLNEFGFQNTIHIHGWDFVDLPLVYGRFLGDHGLRTEGGAVQIDIPSRWGANLALSFGESVAHNHDHGHGEEDHEADHGEEHDHEDHGHSHGTGEDLLFDGAFVSGRLLLPWNTDDFNRWSSQVSVAVGNNASGKQTVIYGGGLSYEWLETGYEPGGARLRTSIEAYGRSWTAGGDDHDHDDHEEHGHEEEHAGEDEHDEEHHDHDGEEITGTDFGFLAEAIYSPSYQWDFGGRIEYVSGDSKADLDERWRFSPVVTWWANEDKNISLRLQYNLDSLPDSEEHSVWLQLGLAWGNH